MEKQILNNKIGIQIMVIITGIILLAFGILCAIYNFMIIPYSDYSYSYRTIPAFIFLGCAIVLVGISSIIIGSIKIANYSLTKKLTFTDCATSDYPSFSGEKKYDTIRNKISSLQQMKTDGLISESEYEEMKSSIIKNTKGLL